VFATVHARLYAALVVSFCVLGLCLSFAQPIYALPDEPAHWMSANVRLEHLFGRSGCVPTILGGDCPRKRVCSSIPALQLTCIEDPGIYGDFFTYPGVVLSKLLLPRQTESAIRQVQAILLSRLLQGLLVVLYLVRIGVLAQRTGRYGGITLGALMLSPLLAQQAFAVSSDGAQLAFGLSMFSVVMFWEALTRLDALAFFVLGYASAAKPTVLPLVAPSVFAGYWFFQSGGAELRTLRETARGLVALLEPTKRPSAQTLIAWSALVLSLLTVAFSLSYDSAGQAAVSAEDNAPRLAHIKELREHPLALLGLAHRMQYNPSLAKNWVGPLGWLNTPIAPVIAHAFRNMFWLFSLLEVAALCAFACWRRQLVAGALRRFLHALPALSVGLFSVWLNLLFITAVMYVLWTPLDAKVVHGIQLRYFFPATMVAIAVVFRTLELIWPTLGERARELPRRARWLAIAAPCLVLALSLPFVARLYVDLSLRYHNPARYQQP
jgi:hypothetical protein